MFSSFLLPYFLCSVFCAYFCSFFFFFFLLWLFRRKLETESCADVKVLAVREQPRAAPHEVVALVAVRNFQTLYNVTLLLMGAYFPLHLMSRVFFLLFCLFICLCLKCKCIIFFSPSNDSRSLCSHYFHFVPFTKQFHLFF